MLFRVIFVAFDWSIIFCFSVGLEDGDDLINDLRQALEKVEIK